MKVTNAVDFILQLNLPADRSVTYATFVSSYRLLKDKLCRRKITIGEDKLLNSEYIGSLVANLLEIKILLNSAISNVQKEARLISANIKDYFLTILMRDPDYTCAKYNYISIDIRRRYNLNAKVVLNYIYIRIKKDIPKLK